MSHPSEAITGPRLAELEICSALIGPNRQINEQGDSNWTRGHREANIHEQWVRYAS